MCGGGMPRTPSSSYVCPCPVTSSKALAEDRTSLHSEVRRMQAGSTMHSCTSWTCWEVSRWVRQGN